jgi:hypothetical protein
MGFYCHLIIIKKSAQQHKKNNPDFIWKNLIKSLNLQKIKRSPNKNEVIKGCIGYCEYLLDGMQLFFKKNMSVVVLATV